MANTYGTEDAFVNSIVGEGCRFRGDIELDGLLRVDGDFAGTIRSSGKVLIGKNGRAECTIHAGTIVIGGVIKGDIFSKEKVIILASGMIIGNIYAPRLIAEEGVVIDGSCIINAQRPVVSENSRRVSYQAQPGIGAARILTLESLGDHQGREYANERSGSSYDGDGSDGERRAGS